MLMTTDNKLEILKERDVSISNEILKDFLSLINKHSIKYVIGKDNKAYFPLGILSGVKGKDIKDFSKNYENSLSISSSGNYYLSKVLAGRFYKLSGEELKSFKESYFKEYKVSFSRTSSLWITDHSGAMSYMFQNNNKVNSKAETNTASKDFQEHATTSLNKNYEHAVNRINNNNNTTRDLPNSTSHKFASEEEIEEALIRLSDFSPIKLTRQYMLDNSPLYNNKEWNTAQSRRLDFIRIERRKVFIYEIKQGSISAEHISQTIGTKGYIDLVKNQYPNKSVKLVFITDAPNNKLLTDCAERLVKTMSKKALRNIQFKTVRNLAEEIVEETLKTIPDKLQWQYKKHRLAEYEYLLT
jgi:hypothetical protein